MQFWVYTRNLTVADGWTLQVDPTGTGNSYVNCLSETGSNHAFQQYTYNVTNGQRTNNVLLRFQFSGGGTGDAGAIALDQIAVTLSGYPVPVTVPMSLTGGVYTAQIPAQASGTQISYFVTAANDVGLSNTDPATAPSIMYSYTVQPSPITWLFDASTPPTVTNNMPAGSQIAGITFNTGAGACILNGNAVNLTGDITSQGPSLQTINLPLTLAGSPTINVAAG